MAKTFILEQKFMTFGEDPKEEVLLFERILLQTIKFDLQVEHPYNYLLEYTKCLKGDENKRQKMVQMAWTFANDSLGTTLPLQWEPEIIAIALMYLAGKLSKFEVVDWVGRQPKHLHWWDMFVEDMTIEVLHDIGHQVLDLYPRANNTIPPDLPPMIPSSGVCQERSVTATTIESASNTPNVTPGKSSKSIEASTISANGCPATDIADTIKPIDISTAHFPTYSTNFASNNTNYPPAFPPTNISVPPPPVNTMNHIVPTMHRIGSSAAIRPTPPPPPPPLAPTANQTAFQPYSYSTNASYFSNNPIPPAAPSRSYYLPQP